MGAWVDVATALGMQLTLELPRQQASKNNPKDWWPVHIALSDYPQLKSLAWQVKGTDYLTPVEANDIYERNVRHLDTAAMTANEQVLWQALQAAFGKKGSYV